MPITLGIDGRLANESMRAGVGHYCYELLRALSPLGEGFQYRVYLDCPPSADFPLSDTDAEIRVLPPGRFWTQWRLGRELRADPPDVFFSPVTQLPIACPCPAIVTVHDLACFSFPDHFPWRMRTAARLQAHHAARNGVHFMADSQATQRDIEVHLSVPPERITVAYLGCSKRFFGPHPPESIVETRSRHGLPERYVLYTGRLQPRKNLSRLLAAFACVCAEYPSLPHHLVLAGDDGWMPEGIEKAIAHSPVRERIHRLGFVSGADLPALMAGADVLALVSLWEGFGLPVVEAMATGTAVLVSNTSSLPEVAGDAAVTVDPEDTEAIAEALARLLSDDDWRHEHAWRGPGRAARFTWESTARWLLGAVREVLGRR